MVRGSSRTRIGAGLRGGCDEEKPSTNGATNIRMEGDVFVHSWFIRGWSLGAAAVGGWGGQVRGGGGSGPRGEVVMRKPADYG